MTKRRGKTDFIALLHTRRMEKLWDLIAEVIRLYFRIQVRGLKNIPRTRPVIIVPNHSGYAGADAVMLSHILHRKIGHRPAILAHPGYFEWLPWLSRLSKSFNLREATFKKGTELLAEGEVIIVFPEGEAGNFKPSWKRYNLQKFHTGFIRMALATGAAIVPCIIIGAEESHLNLGNIDLTKFAKGLRIPLPLNLFPLPAKWKIVFKKPIDLGPAAAINDHGKLTEIAEELRTEFQKTLRHELARRRKR